MDNESGNVFSPQLQDSAGHRRDRNNLLPLSGGGDGVDVLEEFPGDEADGLLDLLFGDAVFAGIY